MAMRAKKKKTKNKTGRQTPGGQKDLRLDPVPGLAVALDLHQRGELEKARTFYLKILDRHPANAETLHLLACLYQQRGEPQLALPLEHKATELAPGNGRYRFGLGIIAQSLGELELAREAYGQAIDVEPAYPEAHNNLGVVFQERQLFAAAEEAFATAVRLRTDYVEAWHNLALVRLAGGRPGEALTAARKCLELRPGYAEGWFNLANIQKARGEIAAAIAGYRTALALDPGHRKAHSSLLFVLNYPLELAATTIVEEHRRWGERFAPAPERPPVSGRCSGRLRIGYVSPDFRSHPVAFFIEEVLDRHDRRRFEVTAYANVARPDAVTERLRGLVDRWRDCRGRHPEEVAEWVREDNIGILIDLAGHSADHLLEVFALRPAPVQLAYLGYPNTTGLEAIDVRLTDGVCDPPGAEPLFSEKLVRLPGPFFCFKPPENAPDPGPLPMEKNGFVTFASFNNLAKISTPLLEQWAQLLVEFPESRLILQSQGLDDPATRDGLLALFAGRDIAASRLEFFGHAGFAEHLELHRRVDIALDSYPWNGHTTTCNTLWMGVPVVTRAGDRTAARMGKSILSHLGLEALIGADSEDYLARARYLATHPELLASLRRELRRRMTASPLTDGRSFTRGLEQAYLDIWQSVGGEMPRANEGAGTSVIVAPPDRRDSASLKEGLSVVLIGKDEETRLPRCLASVKGLAAEIVFVDTGSSDGTQRVAKDFGARLYQFEWCDDFSRARNFGLEQASCRWILSLDCDEEVDSAGARVALEKVLQSQAKPAFLVENRSLLSGGGASAWGMRLFRNDPKIFFTNPVHESVGESVYRGWPEYAPETTALRLNHYGYEPAAIPRKNERNLRMLERWSTQEPDNVFAQYKFAQTLQAMGKTAKALLYFQRTFFLLQSSRERESYPFVPEFLGNYRLLLEKSGRNADLARVEEIVQQW